MIVIQNGVLLVELDSESGNEYNIDNVIIKNNIIIGTRMAIYFFQIGNGGYNNIKILHNTMWLISTTIYGLNNLIIILEIVN